MKHYTPTLSDFKGIPVVCLLVITLLFCESNAFAQKVFSPGLKGALHVQHQALGEAGIALYTLKDPGMWINQAYGPIAGFEYNFKFNSNDFIYAPKVGYDYFFYGCLFQAGISVTDYIRKKQHDPRIGIEAGVSLLVLLNLSYTYQQPLTSTEFTEVSRHRLSMKINFIGVLSKKGKVTFKERSFKNR